MPRRISALTLSLLSLALGCVPGPGSPGSSSGSLPSKGDVIAAGIGVAAVVATITTVVVVDIHNKHTVKGCLVNGPNGLQIQETQENKNVYSLEGAPANLKVGDLVRLHGNRGPKVKKGDVRTFKVTAIKKNFGACPAAPPTPPDSH